MSTGCCLQVLSHYYYTVLTSWNLNSNLKKKERSPCSAGVRWDEHTRAVKADKTGKEQSPPCT